LPDMSNSQIPPSTGEISPDSALLRRITTFTSLRTPHYRWFWLGMLANFLGVHLQLVARNWLVWDMTGSALSLGIVIAAWGLPILLLSFYGGTIADRVRKRNLLIWTQVANACIALIIAVLITGGWIQLWHLIFAAVVEGVIFAFHVPARLAIIPELVTRREVMNAIALNSASMNLSRFMGFAVGGLLLGVIGIAGVYYIVVLAFFLSAGLLFMLPRLDRIRRQVTTSIRTDLMDGLRYINGNVVVRSLLLMAFVCIGFGLPHLNIMPVFADVVHDVGESGFGFMLGASGLGSVVGSLAVASLGDFKRKGMLMLSFAFLFGAMVAMFAFSGSYYMALGMLVLVGGFGAGYLATNSTLVQSLVPHDMLGRVMSIYVTTFSLMPLATLPLGAITDAVGAPLTIGSGGIILALFALGMTALVPRLKRLE